MKGRALILSAVMGLWGAAGMPGAALAQQARPTAHQPLDTATTVDQHDAAARQHYRAQRYDDALREYEAAYNLSQEPIFIFNSAQVLRAKGSYPEALVKYELFLQLQPDPNNPERMQAASYIRDTRRLMEMQERERLARERERLARESERVARENERLAREREQALLAEQNKWKFRAKLAASPSFRSLYGSSFFGVDLGAMLGAQTPRLATFFSLDYFIGSNLFGMLTMDVRQGLTMEGLIDRRGHWRVGGSAYLSILAIKRVTRDDYMVAGGLGLSAHGTLDVRRWGERALYVGLRLGLDGLLVGNDSGARSVMVDLTTLIGCRL